MKYPGKLLQLGFVDAKVMKALKTQLNQTLVLGADTTPPKLDSSDPSFDAPTKAAVKLFQAQRVDAVGNPLRVDGKVGALTWGALFGEQALKSHHEAGDPLLTLVLKIAGQQADMGVREKPRNSNKGPEVSEYLVRAGVWPGLAWCVAYVYWCFDEAAKQLGRPNPMVRTAGVLNHWTRCVAEKGAKRISKSEATANPALVLPGMVFVMDHGGGLGHSGLVERVEGGLIHTLEGNTDASKTREGGGVYRLTRKIIDINKGFVDYRGR